MIVETSAFVAMLAGEPEAAEYVVAVRSAPQRLMSAASFIELGIFADNPANDADHDAIDALIEALKIEIVPVTRDDARLAREAHTRFGRWSGQKAKLNFGDCFSYALSQRTGQPLLFKGNDFGHTDVKRP